MTEGFNYINEGKFVLFREHYDENSRRPIMKGKIEFDDGRPTLFVSAWTKEQKDGKKYLSGTIESRHERADGPPPAQDQQANPQSFKDDEIPF